ncbi:hypothetical protein MMC26_004864 [Xylographa opegraphella]|nr:hypothetical protein [Xylographa opegraphella]
MAVTDVIIATEQADMPIVAGGVLARDRENEERKGAGREIMKEAEPGTRKVVAVEETGEIVCSAAGVEAEAEVETAIGPRRVCQKSCFAVSTYHRKKLADLDPTDEKAAPSRSERQRTRSRSPARNGTSKNPRVRSPLRKPDQDTIKPSIIKPSEPQPTVAPTADKMQVDSPPADAAVSVKPKGKSKSKSKPVEEEDSDPEIAQMRTLMGFAGFKTTKDTKVPGNNVYAVRKEKKTEYRQYMNRVGGFNRPLSPSR